MYRKYLVSNIKVHNKKFDVELPRIYCDYGYLALPYLRTYMFECIEITFDYTRISNVSMYTTEINVEQPFRRDLVDEKHTDLVKVNVLPMYKNNCVVCISDEDLEVTTDDIQQAIYIQLENYLQVDFLIENIK